MSNNQDHQICKVCGAEYKKFAVKCEDCGATSLKVNLGCSTSTVIMMAIFDALIIIIILKSCTDF